jgi:hypothetical protein
VRKNVNVAERFLSFRMTGHNIKVKNVETKSFEARAPASSGSSCGKAAAELLLGAMPNIDLETKLNFTRVSLDSQ